MCRSLKRNRATQGCDPSGIKEPITAEVVICKSSTGTETACAALFVLKTSTTLTQKQNLSKRFKIITAAFRVCLKKPFKETIKKKITVHFSKNER